MSVYVIKMFDSICMWHNMVNTAWANNLYIPIVFILLPINSHEMFPPWLFPEFYNPTHISYILLLCLRFVCF